MAGKKVIEAIKLFREGCPCTGAVALPFCDSEGLDRETVRRLSSGTPSYGGICGALVGALLISNAVNGDCDGITAAFKKEFGSLSCSDIKIAGDSRTCCDRCVMLATALAEKEASKK